LNRFGIFCQLNEFLCAFRKSFQVELYTSKTIQKIIEKNYI